MLMSTYSKAIFPFCWLHENIRVLAIYETITDANKIFNQKYVFKLIFMNY